MPDRTARETHAAVANVRIKLTWPRQGPVRRWRAELMRVNSSVLKRLDLTPAVESQLKRGIARFPSLIIDACLNESTSR